MSCDHVMVWGKRKGGTCGAPAYHDGDTKCYRHNETAMELKRRESHARYLDMTSEQREEYLARRRPYHREFKRKYHANMTREQRAEHLARQRKQHPGATLEQREEYLTRQRVYNATRGKRLTAIPEDSTAQ